MRIGRKKLVTALALAVVVAPFLLPALFTVVTVTEGLPPPQPSDPAFPGQPAPEQPPQFAPDRADPRRPDRPETNSSAAVVRLDIRPIQPEGEAHLDKIYPTYQLAVDFGGKESIPSASLLVSKCRQFDGALSAAVTVAAFEGVKGRMPGAFDVLTRLAAKLPAGSAAADCVGLAQELTKCGEAEDLPKLQERMRGNERRTRMLQEFVVDRSACKPFWFFAWSKQLYGLRCCQGLLNRELAAKSGPALARELGEALRSDPALLADYRRLVDLLRLVAGSGGLSLDEIPSGDFTADDLRGEAAKRGRQASIAFLPLPFPAERVLMNRAGLGDENGDFRALVAFVRGGGLAPPADSAGLISRQAWAMGALLVPASGQERGRLSCTPRYSMRILESFKAAPLRHREFRLRFGRSQPEPVPGPADLAVAPVLRLEPSPEFYLRTAQTYSAVGPRLKAALGNALTDMYGPRETWSYGQVHKSSVDERDDDLATELQFMTRLFWGLYVISCEDLGLVPDLSGPEKPDAAACRQAALNWMASFRRDPDLKPDARFCTALPGGTGRTGYWAVVGVRLARLEAGYDWPPSVRGAGAGWEPVDRARLAVSDRLIAVDATAYFELEGQPMTRCEFWDLLAAGETRDGVLEMVRQAGSSEQLLKAVAEKIKAQGQPAAQ